MQTVNFFMPVVILTGHPTFEEQARWLGRATITQETDYDDQDQPFSVDVADITDLFYLPYAGADIKTARRVELPRLSIPGKVFMYKLEQAAIAAYHNPKLQPAEMPDEIDAGSPSFSEKLAARIKEIAAVGLTADELSKFKAI